MILDGKKVRDEILNKCQEIVEKEKLKLSLAIILIGNNPASEIYVKNKVKYATMVGIKPLVFRFDESTNQTEVTNLISKLNKDDDITGIILQSPIPSNLDFTKISDMILPSKDVDGFTKDNSYSLTHNIDGLRPCTAKGIIELLKYYDISLDGKDVCIIGRGDIVGKPLIFEMLNENATVTVCHSHTKNLKEKTLNSDIIICACGQKYLLSSDMVKEKSIVIDVGISYENGKQYGDVDFDSVKDKCAYITPNPGGIGPMTIAMIIENVIDAYRKGSR